jgi:hypothetical protein
MTVRELTGSKLVTRDSTHVGYVKSGNTDGHSSFSLSVVTLMKNPCLEKLFFLFYVFLFAPCCVSMTINNTNSIIYATMFINLGCTTCFDPNGSSSGVS